MFIATLSLKDDFVMALQTSLPVPLPICQITQHTYIMQCIYRVNHLSDMLFYVLFLGRLSGVMVRVLAT
jgi:hypothetical protein